MRPPVEDRPGVQPADSAGVADGAGAGPGVVDDELRGEVRGGAGRGLHHPAVPGFCLPLPGRGLRMAPRAGLPRRARPGPHRGFLPRHRALPGLVVLQVQELLGAHRPAGHQQGPVTGRHRQRVDDARVNPGREYPVAGGHRGPPPTR